MLLGNCHVSAYATCFARKVCHPVWSFWGTYLGKDKLRARARILNTKAGCRANIPLFMRVDIFLVHIYTFWCSVDGGICHGIYGRVHFPFIWHVFAGRGRFEPRRDVRVLQDAPCHSAWFMHLFCHSLLLHHQTHVQSSLDYFASFVHCSCHSPRQPRHLCKFSLHRSHGPPCL